MEGTTNIHDLEKAPPKRSLMDDSTMNELLLGIEKLKGKSTNAPTQMATRDIPQNTERIVIDEKTVANYIPTSTKRQQDYIEDEDDAYNNNHDNNSNNNSAINISYIDSVYEDLQMPIFVGILFFVFQLPLVKKNIFYFFPNLFASDGHFNLGGYVFTSILFSLIYYIIHKIVLYLE